MDTFLKFVYEFLSQFFNGLFSIFIGIWDGIKKIFSIKSYIEIANRYKGDFSTGEWILFGLVVLVVVIILACIIGLIV